MGTWVSEVRYERGEGEPQHPKVGGATGGLMPGCRKPLLEFLGEGRARIIDAIVRRGQTCVWANELKASWAMGRNEAGHGQMLAFAV